MNFNYTALTRGGRVTTGALVSGSLSDAAQELKETGLSVLSLKVSFRKPALRRQKKLSDEVLSAFFSDLGMYRGSGIPILEALNDLSATTANRLLIKTIAKIKERMEAGVSLTQALRETDVFPAISITTLESGETASDIAKVLLKLGHYHQGKKVLRDNIKNAITYPALVAFFMLAVAGIAIFYLIPNLTPLVENFPLPLFSRIAFKACDLTREYWYLLIIITIGLGTGGYFFAQTPSAQALLNHFYQKNRIGRIINESSLATLYYGLAILHGSGIKLTEAVSSAALSTSQYLSGHLLKVKELLLKKGYSLSQALSIQKGAFPVLVCQTIANGENTGDISGALERVAKIYAEKTTRNMETFSRLLGPALLIVMGGIIATVGLTVLLPIYSNISTMAMMPR